LGYEAHEGRPWEGADNSHAVAARACLAGYATETTSLSYRPATASRIDTKR